MRSNGNLAGILITVSIHLAVIIVLLLTVVEPGIRKQSATYEFDFTKQDEMEKLEKEVQRQKALNDRLEKLLKENGVGSEPVRNVTVDRGSLKDDRGTDAEKLYREAERIQKQYEEIMSRGDDSFIAMKEPRRSEKKEEEQKSVYSGPSVLSYEVPGRKGSYLPIPAYKCMGEGEVTVNVTVNPQGKVIAASVKDDVSSDDSCLRAYAVRAAQSSMFSSKAGAPAKEYGYITYRFIAQ
ncbi:MAG: energy transducer TonB [Candidatus Cryptobacteroides sp.]